MTVTLAKVQTSDRLLNQLQQNIIGGLEIITKNPLASGTFLTNVALASGDNTVQTGLDYPITGWLVVRQRASATIYDKQDTNANASTTLVLNASGAVTVDLYIF